MKLADKPNFDTKRRASTTRSVNVVELDDDIFMPTDPVVGGNDPDLPTNQSSICGPVVGVAGLRNDLGGSAGTNPIIETEGRPCQESLEALRLSVCESATKQQSGKIIERDASVIDRCNTWRQDMELTADELVRVNESIAGLQGTVKRQKSEIAATTQKLTLSDEEKLALRAQLDKALNEHACLLQRLLIAEAALNDRETALASTHEIVRSLKAKFTALSAKAIKLAASGEEANQRHRNELDQQRVDFKNKVRKAEAIVAKKDLRIKDLENTHAKLVGYCDDLANALEAFENPQRHKREAAEPDLLSNFPHLKRVWSGDIRSSRCR